MAHVIKMSSSYGTTLAAERMHDLHFWFLWYRLHKSFYIYSTEKITKMSLSGLHNDSIFFSKKQKSKTKQN